jgi:hypothetical protein
MHMVARLTEYQANTPMRSGEKNNETAPSVVRDNFDGYWAMRVCEWVGYSLIADSDLHTTPH